MKESKNNTILNQYLREARFYCYYELKVAKGTTFSFSKIEDNQDEGLPALQKNGLVWKLSDEDSRKKPCDGFCAPPLPSYLVIKFSNKFYFVPYVYIEVLKMAEETSISEEQCSAVADKIIHI